MSDSTYRQDLDEIVTEAQGSGQLRDLVDRFTADWQARERALPPRFDPAREERLATFYADWQDALAQIDRDALPHPAQIDAVLLANLLDYEQQHLHFAKRRREEVAPLVPFADLVSGLDAERRAMTLPDPVCAAQDFRQIAFLADARRTAWGSGNTVSTLTARRAERAVRDVLAVAEKYFTFYDGYDPLFSWWARDPYQVAKDALTAWADVLCKAGGGEDGDRIVGDPIGRDALLLELSHELIAYTPEELIAIGDREYAWCEDEMRRAARELGHGDDWRAALEQVKNGHVAPGEQVGLVRDLAHEAIDYVEGNDLVTVPALARDIWRMEMMAPERQKVSPFFLGGETIIVSFPTNTMGHDAKQMSLRGNNRHFARATVQHELIPGHHLQLFMAERYRAYRAVFRTPFFVEGWALHWEMLLWDRGFAMSPKDRIGMLFWRMHRCARISFSLRYHMEQMSADECVQFLIERVGHEPDNARGEVRRSLGDDYPPLYQAAYMLGGLQMRALYRELVQAGDWTDRRFHDAVLRENAIPISLLRAALADLPIEQDALAHWRFDRDAASVDEGKDG